MTQSDLILIREKHEVALHVAWRPIGGRGPAFGDAMWALLTRLDGGLLWDHLRYMLLPALALGAFLMAVITRLTRSSLLEVLGKEDVRTARAKGLRDVFDRRLQDG